MAKNPKDTSGGEPRKVEIASPYDVPRPKADPGADNNYDGQMPNFPRDPTGLLPENADTRKK